MKKPLERNLFLLGVTALIVALDQYTKYLVKLNLVSGESWAPFPAIGNFLRIVNWHNTGAAFGIFQNANTILLILALVIAALTIYYYQKIDISHALVRWSLALMLGGALGNVIDRISQGFVTDFVAIGNFPVFNVADSCVTIGVGFLLLATLLQEREDRNKPQMGEDSSLNQDQPTAKTE